MRGNFKKLLCVAFGERVGFATQNEWGGVHSGSAIFMTTPRLCRPPMAYSKFNLWLKEKSDIFGGFDSLAVTNIGCRNHHNHYNHHVTLDVWRAPQDLPCALVRKLRLDEFMGVDGENKTITDAVIELGHEARSKCEAYAIALLKCHAENFRR